MLGKSLTEVLHETAEDIYDAGVISEQTMCEFDAMCLPKIKQYTPNQIWEVADAIKGR